MTSAPWSLCLPTARSRLWPESKSPELRAAEESVRQEEFHIKIARAAYLPTLSFDYFFGINSRQFADS